MSNPSGEQCSARPLSAEATKPKDWEEGDEWASRETCLGCSVLWGAGSKDNVPKTLDCKSMAEMVRLFSSIMRYVLRVASHRMSEPPDLRDRQDQRRSI